MDKLSYASGTSDIPLIGRTIGDHFDKLAAKYADNEALVVKHQNVRWTYAQLHERVEEAARAFLSIGIKREDRVGIWALNRAAWTIVQFATAKIGAILVNINPNYQEDELEYALKQSGCSVLVMADRTKYLDYTGMVNNIIPELKASDPGELKSEKLPMMKRVIRLSDEVIPGVENWSEFLKRGTMDFQEELKQRQGELTFDDPINIQYTSGTTGRPKGATLTHHNIINNAFFVMEGMKITDKDRIIIPVPLYHCFGMVLGNLGCVTHGATMIYPSDIFDPEAVLQAADEEKATALYGVPTMFIAELEVPDFHKYDLSSMRTGIMAGAPCPEELMKKVRELMHVRDIEIAYGMTETSPVSTQTYIDTPVEKRISTVGQVHPHTEIKIIDPDTGRTVPVGERGELCTRGYSVMLKYWNDEEKTSDAIDEARWMHSGDLAVMDEQGYFKIVGRIKDMIIRGGENIYPREIEEFLFTNEKIANVQVIGVPSEKYGEEVMAWIELHEGQSMTEEEVKDYCKGKIAHFKMPRYIKFTSDFPLTATGKVRKIEMRDISIRELGLG